MLVALLLIAAGGGWAYYRHVVAEHLKAADAELSRYRYVAAWEHARRAARLEWPQRAQTEFLAARLARRAGELNQAKSLLAAAEKQLGETAEIRLEKRLLDIQSGNASASLESTMEVRAAIEANHRILILEALVQGALVTTRLYRIKQLTDEWLKEPSPDPRPYFWRGFAHERFGGFQQDRAIADYQAALQRDPEYLDARDAWRTFW